jgi:hypothetical protein
MIVAGDISAWEVCGADHLSPVLSGIWGRSCFMWLELQGRLSATDCEKPFFTEIDH